MNDNTFAADNLTENPFLFFGDVQKDTIEHYYKIYNDGGHFVATSVSHHWHMPTQRNYVRKDIDILFDSLFYEATSKGLNNIRKRGQMTEYIKEGIEKHFADYPDIDGYIEHQIKRAYHSLGVRKKRFRRKAYLNRWNHFVTFTFDDKKHSAEIASRNSFGHWEIDCVIGKQGTKETILALTEHLTRYEVVLYEQISFPVRLVCPSGTD